MNLSITFPGVSSAQGSLRNMAQSVQANALRQATAKAAAKGQTVAKREIAKEYNVKVRDAGRAFSISRNVRDPTTGLPAAIITASGKRGRNVILFLQGQRGRKRTRGPKPQLKFQIRRGRTVTIDGAFVMTANRGTFVAQRYGSERLPVKAVATIDVPGMFKARRIMEATKRQISEVFMPEETTRGLRDAINRATRG